MGLYAENLVKLTKYVVHADYQSWWRQQWPGSFINIWDKSFTCPYWQSSYQYDKCDASIKNHYMSYMEDFVKKDKIFCQFDVTFYVENKI